jgi:hypothetical protein
VINDNRFDLILDRVWEEVQYKKQGVLYKTISILDLENTDDICRKFGIDKNSYHKEDIQVLSRIKYLSDLLNTITMGLEIYSTIINVGTTVSMAINTGITMFQSSDKNSQNNLTEVKAFPENNRNNLSEFKITNELTIQFIIAIGLIVIGLYLWDRYRNPSNPASVSSQSSERYTPKPDAFLCLVVQTNRIDLELRNLLLPEEELTREVIKSLLDSSIYFVVSTAQDLDNYIGRLNLSNTQINYDEEGEIFIQILLPEGEDSIGQDMQRVISRNLPDVAIIQSIYLLNDLSNIEQFHRA